MPARLGQHFLKNESAIKKIIAALDIQAGETIIEIGPGRGALTFPLAEECIQKKCRLIAVEKDKELFSNLKEKYKDSKNIIIIEGDVLKELEKIIEDLEIENGSTDSPQVLKFKIIGNIPYYITGKLLRTISELKNKPISSVLMVQKEVAERLSGRPPQNNLLASAMAIWANTEIILDLKASEFDPPPEVDSTVIKLITKTKQLKEQEAESYYKLIHIIFKQPRKTLANNLKAGLNIPRIEIESVLNSLNLPLNSRPQDVSIENILELLQILIKYGLLLSNS